MGSGQGAISIHALREEGDANSVKIDIVGGISIHALREEGDATDWLNFVAWRNFYPRPPRGGRLFCLLPDFRQGTISIHALREEGDFTSGMVTSYHGIFLSTPSARRATLERCLRGSVRPSFLSTPSARRATY